MVFSFNFEDVDLSMFCLTRFVMVSTLCVALNFSLPGNELISESTTLMSASTFSKDIDEDVNDERRT